MEYATEIDEQEVDRCEIIEETDDMIKMVSYKVDGSSCITTTTEFEVKKEYYSSNGSLVYEQCNSIDEETAEMLSGLNSEEDSYLPEDTDELYDLEDGERPQDNLTSGSYDSSNKKLSGTVCEVYNGKHWYNMCKLKGKKVLFIGCDASYRIEYSKLSKEKKANCTEYIDCIKASNHAVIWTVTGLAVCTGIAIYELLPVAANVMDFMAQGLSKKEIFTYVQKQIAKKWGASVAKKFVGAYTSGTLYDLASHFFTGKDFLSNRNKLKKYYSLIRGYGKKVIINSHSNLSQDLLDIGLGKYNQVLYKI